MTKELSHSSDGKWGREIKAQAEAEKRGNEQQGETLRLLDSIEHFARALLKQVDPSATATGTQMIADAILSNVAALRSRPVSAAPADEWLPIETAPKQRKIIVGYLNPLGKWRTVLARYYLENELEWHDQSPNYGEGFAPEGWYELCETHEDILPTDFEPTHWRLLPEPPASTTSSPAAQPDSESKAKAIVEEYKQRVVQLPSGDAVPCAKWLEMRLRIAFDLLADPSPAAASEGEQDE